MSKTEPTTEELAERVRELEQQVAPRERLKAACSRREFIYGGIVGAAGLAAMTGTASAQTFPEDFHGMALLIGDDADKPVHGGQFFKNKSEWNFIYFAEDTGARYVSRTGDKSWSLLDLKTGTLNTEEGSVTHQPDAQTDIARPVDSASPIGNLTVDGAWTWFNQPRATYDPQSNTTFSGWMNRNEDVVVAAVDHDTGIVTTNVLKTNFGMDDHNNPGIILRSDGELLVGYSGHSTTNLFYRISSSARDISSFDAEQTLTEEGDNSTYCQLVRLSDEGAIYWFFRDDKGSTQNTRSLSFWRSTDDGATWSGPTDLIHADDSNGFEYFRLGTNGTDRIDLGLTDAENGQTNPHNDVKHLFIKNQTVFTSDGTQVATFSDAEPLTSHTEATMIYDSAATGNSAWIHDCATHGGQPAVVYAELVSSTNHNWRYARWTGSQWVDNPLGNAGERITDPAVSPEGFYSAGASLDPARAGVVYYGAGDHTISQIYRAETDDNGSTWRLEAISGNSRQNVRPVVPRTQTPSDGAHKDLPVVWMHGYYHDALDINDGYQTAIVGNDARADHEPRSAVGVDTDTSVGGTATAVPWDTLAVSNQEDHRVGILDTTNNKLTVPEDGVYSISVFLLFADFTAAGGAYCRIKINGGRAQLLDRRQIDTATNQPMLHGSVTFRLSAGDEITCETTQDSGSTQTLKASAGISTGHEGHTTKLVVSRQ